MFSIDFSDGQLNALELDILTKEEKREKTATKYKNIINNNNIKIKKESDIYEDLVR